MKIKVDKKWNHKGELVEDNEIVLGCKHYKRKCEKKCEDCQEFFACRFCHDEEKYYKEYDPKKNHQMRRHDIKEVRCLLCRHV